MRKLQVFTAFLLMLAVLTTAVFAEEFVPSKEQGEGPGQIGEPDETGKTVVGYIYNEDGTIRRPIYEDDLIITPYWHLDEEDIQVPEEIEKTLKEAFEDLDGKTPEDFLHDFDEIWEEATGGAPHEHATLTEILDVRFQDNFTGKLEDGQTVTFNVKVEGLEKDDLFIIIGRRDVNDKWHAEEWTMNEENVLTITLNGLHPIAILTDGAYAPGGSGEAPDSPKTGVETGRYVLPMLGCAVIALGAVCGIRKSGKHEA